MADMRERIPLFHFRTEILNEAQAICRDEPGLNLQNPRVAHLCGVIAMQQRRLDLAIAFLTHAIRLDASRSEAYNDLGDVFQLKGRGSDAIAAHLRALTLRKTEAVRYTRLGSALQSQLRHVDARAVYIEALRLSIGDASLAASIRVALGDLEWAAGHTDGAVQQYLEAIRLAPDGADSYHRHGRLRLSLGEPRAALAHFEQGLMRDRNRVALHVGVGEAQLRLNAFDMAARAFHAALTINPGDITAARQYVLALELANQRSDAVGGWVSLGTALEAGGELKDAAVAYRQAIARKADCLHALIGLGRVQVALGNFQDGIRRLDAAIALNPQRTASRVEAGLALHRAGQMERGWDELAWYHHPSGPTWLRTEQPVWDGSRLDGGTVLLWADGPPAETIQHLGYVTFAKARCARVVVECDRALVPLVKHMTEADHVLALDGPRPHFDAHAPLRYFPALVRSARSAIATDASCLRVPDTLKAEWRQRLCPDQHPLVGIVWAGGPEDTLSRSFSDASLLSFAPLAHVGGVRWLSLQSGPHRHELLAPPLGLHVEEILADSNSLADVAAIVANLDLVVGVDSCITHLAGTLRRPVWTLLPQYAKWPWPIADDTVALYPTMRLFRQTRSRDWTDVLERVRVAIVNQFDVTAASRLCQSVMPPRHRIDKRYASSSSRREIWPPSARTRGGRKVGAEGNRTYVSYERSILDAAREMTHSELERDSRQADLLHLSGLIEASDFQPDAAIAYFKRAVALDQTHGSWYADLAEALSRRKLGTEAVAAALIAVRIAPRLAQPYRVLSRTLRDEGRLHEAVAVCLMALTLDPAEPLTHGELADLLLMQRRPRLALHHYELKLQGAPFDSSGYRGVGRALWDSGEHNLAIGAVRQGLLVNPDDVQLHVLLGEFLIDCGAYHDAVEVLRNGLSIDPLDVNGCQQLVRALRLAGNTSDLVGACLGLADSLQIVNNYEDATGAYREALVHKPDSLPARLGLAHMLIAIGKHQQAYAPLSASLSQDPQNPRARIDMATVFHLDGELPRGWAEFAWYYNMHSMVWRTFEQPLWDGSPLDGRTILLWTAIGRGDSIHGLRFIHFARERGGRIVVECHHASLVEFAASIPGVERTIVAGAPLPSFDVHAPLVFFPSFVPASRDLHENSAPYISADPSRVDAWARRLGRGTERLVGLSWAGNIETAPLRFISLRTFEILADIANVRYISLQHGPQAAELLALPSGLRIEPCVTAGTSIADVAALILNLDLVISVDTMVAHLAGALGVPVWTLLRYAANWLWPSGSDRTPHYPTMRLFRQMKPGDWDGVLVRVRAALEELVPPLHPGGMDTSIIRSHLGSTVPMAARSASPTPAVPPRRPG